MQHVETVRVYTLRCVQHALIRLRGLISTLGTEVTPMVDRLHGKEGDEVAAATTDTVMAELGHATLLDSRDSTSVTRRLVRRATRGG